MTRGPHAAKELQEFGLLTVGRASSSNRDLEYTRRRNTYELDKQRLSEPVPIDVVQRRIDERAKAAKRQAP